MKIIGYKMLSPGTTRGAITDKFYRWTSGQEFSCPEVPPGEFVHMDPNNCVPIVEEQLKGQAPQVVTTSIEAPETRPVKKTKAKSE